MRNIMKKKIRALVTLQIKWVEDSAFFLHHKTASFNYVLRLYIFRCNYIANKIKKVTRLFVTHVKRPL